MATKYRSASAESSPPTPSSSASTFSTSSGRETRRRLVLIPDRMSAENERDKLRREHGPVMVAAKITKIGTGKSGTYTLAYTLRKSKTEELF